MAYDFVIVVDVDKYFHLPGLANTGATRCI